MFEMPDGKNNDRRLLVRQQVRKSDVVRNQRRDAAEASPSLGKPINPREAWDENTARWILR